MSGEGWGGRDGPDPAEPGRAFDGGPGLAAALALCAAAAVVVLLGGPDWLSVLVVGVFMLAAPGLVLVVVLRVRDPLLGLVLAMMAGPALWVVLSMLQVFVGLWVPRAAVLVVAGLLSLAATMLLRGKRRDQIVVRGSGRHRGAFPAP